MEDEQIVFVGEDGTPTGETGPKLASHNANTKLHLAFSCYIFRKSDNKFLLARRAASKKVWPGVWTNSFCGHPMPGEKMEDALQRRGKFELGLNNLESIKCVLPSYRYTTPPYNGIIENEFCPVFVAYTDDEPKPNPDEVEEYIWVTWSEYTRLVETEPSKMSYWAPDQYKHLKNLAPTKLFNS